MQNWEMEYTELLVEAGFRQGASCTREFYSEQKNVRIAARGGDVTVLGLKESLDCFLGVLQSPTGVNFKASLERGREKEMRVR